MLLETGFGRIADILGCRRCFLCRTQRILSTGTGWRGILWSRSPRHSNRHRYHHPRHTHTRSSRWTRSPHPRIDISHSKAIQVPRQQRDIICRQGPEPWSLSCRPVWISQIQTSQWSCRPKSMLRCSSIHHGEWCQGLRGRCQRKTACCSCQVHEIHGTIEKEDVIMKGSNVL